MTYFDTHVVCGIIGPSRQAYQYLRGLSLLNITQNKALYESP